MIRPTDVTFDRSNEFDFVIACCGYEDRSTYLCRLGLRGAKNFAIRLPGNGDLVVQSQLIYQKLWWEIASAETVYSECELQFKAFSEVRICVDISSMPRVLLARTIEWLWKVPHDVIVQFVYCPAEFFDSEEAAKASSPLSAAPVSGFFGGELRAPSLPIGLVLGLGLEPHRAIGLIELLEPSKAWAFLAEGADDRFALAAEGLHRNLIADSSEIPLLRYEVESLERTYSALESLAFTTGVNYRLLFAPSGPKMFSLACLLVAAPRSPERPAVWRVGRDSSADVKNVKASGEVFASEVEFRNRTLR